MSPLTLGIDTSGAVSVAVARGDDVLANLTDERARHHDEVLLAMINQVLESAGAERADLQRVVAGRGPGPFTGLRVGLVTARSIAAVLGLEILGISSLEALALEAAEADADVHTIGVALDARRKEVYVGTFEAGVAADGTRTVEPTSAPSVHRPADAARVLNGADAIVGSGAHLYPADLPPTGQIRHAQAGALVRAANAALRRGADLTSTDPLYLRDADAAKPTRRKSALGLGDRAI